MVDKITMQVCYIYIVIKNNNATMINIFTKYGAYSYRKLINKYTWHST